mmetsp:Transcript_9465/g.22280  ORF Transcript_9465/g.22280 Transcript_9465/m.22280 type:complete len:202 (-) Transcript_9465:227-832(-)
MNRSPLLATTWLSIKRILAGPLSHCLCTSFSSSALRPSRSWTFLPLSCFSAFVPTSYRVRARSRMTSRYSWSLCTACSRRTSSDTAAASSSSCPTSFSIASDSSPPACAKAPRRWRGRTCGNSSCSCPRSPPCSATVSASATSSLSRCSALSLARRAATASTPSSSSSGPGLLRACSAVRRLASACASASRAAASRPACTL